MERDDLIVNDKYALDAHHDEETGKKVRKKIWFVTILLTLITVVEVGIGIYMNRITSPDVWGYIKLAYIILTLAKAAYIVLVFMHLGDERKNLRNVILAPYIIFIVYLIFICITESTYLRELWGWL